MMVRDSQELLFLVAKDFVQLTPRQQANIGIKLQLVTLGCLVWPPEKISETIFSKAYQEKKIPLLVQEMQKMMYE